MFGCFEHKPKREMNSSDNCPYEIEHPEMPRVGNCRGCRWNQGLCLAPFQPRLFISSSGRLMLCIDRRPCGDAALRQAEAVAREAWNASRS